VENKKRRITAIREIIPGVLEEITRSNIHEQVELEKIWADIARDASGVALNGFKDGVVYIIVDSSARLFYWKQRRATILKRFQERRPDVQNIGFKIGTVK
jgi:predicted nucleic acid-binding Zn ribbon protein